VSGLLMICPGSNKRRKVVPSPSQRNAMAGLSLLDWARLARCMGRLKDKSRAAGPEVAVVEIS
jgi:hypothetical protein